MSAAKVKAERDRRRYFEGLYRDARADALREAEALVAILRGRASLKRIHYASHAAHMAAALLMGHTSGLAYSRERTARRKAGKRGPASLAAMGWPDPAERYNARRNRPRA